MGGWSRDGDAGDARVREAFGSERMVDCNMSAAIEARTQQVFPGHLLGLLQGAGCLLDIQYVRSMLVTIGEQKNNDGQY